MGLCDLEAGEEVKRYTIGKHTDVENADGDWCKWEEVALMLDRVVDLKSLLLEATKENVALKEVIDELERGRFA